LHLARRGVVAVVIDDHGTELGQPKTAARTPNAMRGLLDHVEATHGQRCRIIISGDLLSVERGLAQLVARRSAAVFVVPERLVAALATLTGSARSPPKKVALLLARLPLCGPLAELLEPLRLQLELL
jgi:hypothetical protein